MLARDADHLAGVLAVELRTAFSDLAEQAAAVYLVETDNGKSGSARIKSAGIVARILNQLRLGQWRDTMLQPHYRTHYQRIGRRTVNTINQALDLDLTLTDQTLARLGNAGARRVTLLDLEEDTRRSITRAIRDGTEAGDNPVDVARRVRREVPAGRYVDAGPKYRAELIARTETMHAQRLSSLDMYAASELIDGATALDGDQDPDCAERNGLTFPIDQARVESEREHPLGTLTWLPHLI